MERSESLCTVGRNVKCSHHGKQYGSSSEKLNTAFPCDPVIPLLGIYPKELGAGSQRDICACIAALFTIAKKVESTQCLPVDEWINKTWYIHTMECKSALEWKEILSQATTWMNVEAVLSERSQSHEIHAL